MPEFGNNSNEMLDAVDPQLVRVMERVVAVRDITVISGFRGKEEQDRLFAEGSSKKQWPDSRHNRNKHGQLRGPAIAVDIAPWNTQQIKQIPWDDEKAFIHLAGLVDAYAAIEGVKVRWGGNWDRDEIIMDDQTFQDLGHFELVT